MRRPYVFALLPVMKSHLFPFQPADGLWEGHGLELGSGVWIGGRDWVAAVQILFA
jgi:hypothetical protein